MIEHSTYQNSDPNLMTPKIGQNWENRQVYTWNGKSWILDSALRPGKPLPPPNILYCESCGILKNGKHTGWMCRFLNWIDDKWK